MQNSAIKTHILRGWLQRPILFVAFLFTLLSASAQQYSVIGSLQIQSTMPTNWNGFTMVNGQNRMTLNLTWINGETAIPPPIRLKMYLEKGNTLIATSTEVVANAPSINNLVLNQALPLYDSNIAPYFQFYNLQGMSQSQYDRQLEDGFYRVSFEAYNANTNARLSAPISQTFFVSLNPPPVLSQPSNGEQIPNGTSSINFQWIPQASTSITTGNYELKVVKVPQGTTNLAAVFDEPMYVYKGAEGYNVNTKPLSLNLEAGETYAWRVQVVEQTGRVSVVPHPAFKNNGYSDIFTFTYAPTTANCPAPTNLTLTAKASDVVAVSWLPSNLHYAYRVAYRKRDPVVVWQWTEITTTNTSVNLTGLESKENMGIEYEVRVGGICSADNVSFSDIHYVTTLPLGQVAGLNCGTGVTQPDAGTAISTLSTDDIITAGDFPVTLTYVTGANGNFSGQGWILVPWMGSTKIKVKFSGITVNTDKKLTSGTIETVYDPSWGNIISLDGNPNSSSNVQQITGIIYDCTLKLNDLLGLIASSNSQEITKWITNNRDLFNSMVQYLTTTSFQNAAAQDRLRRIQELVNLLVGQGANPTAANVQELARLLEDERIARLLSLSILPEESPAPQSTSPPSTANARVVTTNLWVTPAGTPVKMESGAVDEAFSYCYWDLENGKIPAGALRGFKLANGKRYAAAFSKNNVGEYEFLGYYDYIAWRQAGKLSEVVEKFTPTDVIFDIVGGKAAANLVTQTLAGDNTNLKYTTANVIFSTQKAVALPNLDASNRSLIAGIPKDGIETEYATNTIPLKCKPKLGGDESVTLINKTNNAVTDQEIIDLFKSINFKSIKPGTDAQEISFSTIIVSTSTAYNNLPNTIAQSGSNQRVLYLRLDDANKKIVDVSDAYSDDIINTPIHKSLHTITEVIRQRIQDPLLVSPLDVVASIFRGLADIINLGKIPEKYYNVGFTEGGTKKYESWIFDIWRFTNTNNIASPLVRSALERAYGIQGRIINNITTNHVEFAFYCGLWNGLVDQVSGLASSGAIISDAPETIYNLVFNVKEEGHSLGAKDELFTKIEAFQEKANSVGGYWSLVNQEVVRTMTLNNACQNSETYGEVITNIATIFVSFTKVAKTSQFFRLLDDLDAFNLVLKVSGKVISTLGVGVKITAVKGKKFVIKFVDASGNILDNLTTVTKVFNKPGYVYSCIIPIPPGNNNPGLINLLWDKVKDVVIKTDINGKPMLSEPSGNYIGELKTTDGESMLVEVVKDAWKNGSYLNIDSWLSSITNNVAKKSYIEDILLGWQNDFRQFLDADLLSQSYGSELKQLILDNPDDLENIYKLLKTDPHYAFNVAQDGHGNWEKWSKGNFFKTVTKAGKDFEDWFTDNITNYEPFKTLLKPLTQGGQGYVALKQIYLKRVTALSNNTLNIVADNLLVKQVTEQIQGQNVKYWRAVINDCKLNTSSPWTENQKSELLQLFKQDANRSFIEFEVRSERTKLIEQNAPFSTEQKIRIYRDDVYKAVKDGSSAQVISMKSINFN